MNSHNTRTVEPSADSPEKKRRPLISRGFLSLLGITFFGTANDNFLKQLLMLMVVAGGFWVNAMGEGTQGYISLVLTVPFVFLSGYAGQIADKYSKRDVILWVKIAEVPIAIGALLGLWWGSFWLSLIALLLLAIQSSFFGPAKFGIIPDVVGDQHLSRANGLINAISNIAVILGSMIAGPLTAAYYPTILESTNETVVRPSASASTLPAVTPVAFDGQAREYPTESKAAVTVERPVIQRIPDPTRAPQRLPAGLLMVVISILGVGAAIMMPRTPAVAPKLKLSVDLLNSHIQTFRDSSWPLLMVLFLWSGFYLIGALALMQLPEYKEILQVSDTAITNLVGLLAISIVLGSGTVGFLSGSEIRPRLSLIGAGGMTLSFLLMGVLTMDYWTLGALTFLVGFFAGFYIVPLQALLQYLSPAKERGQFFGTANALSFVFISAAGVIYILMSQLGLSSGQQPLICALFSLMVLVTAAIVLKKVPMQVG